jgi:type I restriction enzyme, S subunit
MNPARVLEQFERLADAPDAVPRLRKLILDLAVRGKLIEQDAKDEPANELLKRIRDRKSKSVADGDNRKGKPIPPIETTPYHLPANWGWTQLAEIGFINPRNTAEDETSCSFLPMASISAEYGVECRPEVRSWGEIFCAYPVLTQVGLEENLRFCGG